MNRNSLPNWLRRRHLEIVVVAALLLSASSPLQAEREYIHPRKLALISAASLTPFVLGELVGKIDSSRSSLIPDPLPGDRWIQGRLGGSWRVSKTNFFDQPVGSLIVPVGAAGALMIVNVAWPENELRRDVPQDLVLFASGLALTEGITNLAKVAVARKRPYLEFEPELAAQRSGSDPDEDRRSFFSGHVSSAMFSATYLNKRLRYIMRNRLSANDYRKWRWASPTILYGITAVVGWSRIAAYKHYFSDVVAGAAIGYAFGELYFHFGKTGETPIALAADGTNLRITWSF